MPERVKLAKAKNDKMFQVTIVTNMLITVYYFAILLGQTTSTAAVDKEVTLTSAAMNHDLGMNRANSDLLCLNSAYLFDQLRCTKSGPQLKREYCVTYNENTKVISVFNCPYFQRNCYNMTQSGWRTILPKNLSQLNNYMCGRLNRKGLVCSECADGFGPSVTSFGYKCTNCTDAAWYGVPLFLFLEFIPITVFYLVILVFQIRVTSAPMPCFIMYAQFVVIAFDSSTSTTPLLQKIIPKEEWNSRLDIRIGLLLYRVFNLEFGHYLIPPFCISRKLKSIHLACLGYISAFYPLILIYLTWISVELHGRNFRLLVWLWRPFHRCFVRLRRGWDTKSDIIDVFTTFFLLSYGKIMYQTLLLTGYYTIINIDKSGQHFVTYQCLVDQSVLYGSKYHLLFAIPAVMISLVFNVLPLLLLILYPTKAFRSCLSKFHLNSIVLNIFIEKIQGCYRNGLDGGRDMRNFSGLYFFLRIVPFLITALLINNSFAQWYYYGTLFFITTLTIAFAKPYRKTYMNYLDAFLLSNHTLLSFIVLAGSHMLQRARILLVAPILILILTITFKVLYHCTNRCLSKYTCLSQKCRELRSNVFATTVDTAAVSQPLIQPTHTEVSYGINNNDIISPCEDDQS